MNRKDLTKATKESALNMVSTNEFMQKLDIRNNLTILDDLKDYIPKLTPEEYEGLEESIVQYGCKIPLMIWDTTRKVVFGENYPNEPLYVLIDGHNRHEICQKHNIDFGIDLMSFDDINQVKDFMIEFQLNRRNVTPLQASYLRGIKYRQTKKARGSNQHSQNTENVLDKLAEEFDVSPITIMRDFHFAENIDKLEEKPKKEILSGKSEITKKDISKLSKVELPEKIESIEKVKELIDKAKDEEDVYLISSKNPELSIKPINKLANKLDISYLKQIIVIDENGKYFISEENIVKVEGGINLN